MKKLTRVSALALALATAVLSGTPAFAANRFDSYGRAKNVIVMIPDGTSVEATTLAR